MEKSSMTALVSAFSRAYHAQRSGIKVFDDTVARRLLSDEEFAGIGANMARGIAFFNPAFSGDAEAALRFIVDNQLSPSPLGRAAFAEGALRAAVEGGARQYLIFAAGYDTFAYRQPEWARDIEIFEIDHPDTARDKGARLARAGVATPKNAHRLEADFTKADWEEALLRERAFEDGAKSFSSMLGLAYYLSKADFSALLAKAARLTAAGGALVFDYPDQDSYTELAGPRAQKQRLLAGGANESMLASYSMSEMEALLAEHGFAARTHLTPEAITARCFAAYNVANPQAPMTAFDNVNYILAERV